MQVKPHDSISAKSKSITEAQAELKAAIETLDADIQSTRSEISRMGTTIYRVSLKQDSDKKEQLRFNRLLTEIISKLESLESRFDKNS